MAVVESNISWRGWTASYEKGDKREYKVPYRVRTNNALDGPNVVVNNYGGPKPGDFGYVVGNDFDPSARCISVQPQRVSENESRLDWLVIATFSTESPEENDEDGTDSSGKPTNNPLDFRPHIEITPQKFTIPVECAYNLKKIGSRPKKTKGPIMSSAGEIYVPAYERDDTRWLYSFTRNLADLPDMEIQDTVNNDVLIFTWPNADFSASGWLIREKYTCKCENISARFMYQNGVMFWRVTLELLYRKDTWRPEILDRGVLTSADSGDDDMVGGSYDPNTQSQTQTKIEDGQSYAAHTIDPHGRPIGAPIMLDGKGKPLPRSKWKKPVYFRWRVYDEEPLSPIVDKVLH